ncbi:helix-hairpin-helix domain-containing protein [Cellvibrio sp. KY-GH-1]|uniref:ComEA family DNA-binding protein n=1 Tax=Cellvibrio sp. KY-GH-1 TaxID=2303332 RepID=UPI001247FD11|nr:helix-hairpin-helix domain-containing protein [Cellvibrio sp. KY-GH-1]
MKALLTVVSLVVLMLGGVSTALAVEGVSVAKPAKAEVVVPKNVVNINTADAQELTKLKGVGEKKAEAIIAWRTENGGFKTVDDLLEVKGIGEATLEANRENISI